MQSNASSFLILECNVKQCMRVIFGTDVHASSIHPVCVGICPKKVSHHVTSFTYNCSRKSHLVVHVLGPFVIPSHEMANYSAKKEYQQRTTWK